VTESRGVFGAQTKLMLGVVAIWARVDTRRAKRQGVVVQAELFRQRSVELRKPEVRSPAYDPSYVSETVSSAAYERGLDGGSTTE